MSMPLKQRVEGVIEELYTHAQTYTHTRTHSLTISSQSASLINTRIPGLLCVSKRRAHVSDVSYTKT